MNPLIRRPPPAPDQTAWTGSLVAGAVVAGVVWGLLEALRRAVGQVEHGVEGVWAAGQRVAANTQTTHLLLDTARHSATLRSHLDGGRSPKEAQV